MDPADVVAAWWHWLHEGGEGGPAADEAGKKLAALEAAMTEEQHSLLDESIRQWRDGLNWSED